MNERDYTLIEYGFIIAGVCLVGQWLLFSMLFDIPLTGMNLVFLVIVGIISVFFAMVAHFKRIIYVHEMTQYMKKGDEHATLDRDTAQKLR